MTKLMWTALLLMAVTSSTLAQEYPHWNFNIGGGPGFPLGSTSDFANTGGHFVLGGGRNFDRPFGISGEFMWHALPIKESVINALQVPSADAREYSLTVNGIFRIPTSGRLGFYLIGGGGWYRRSGETTAPAIVPGTVCSPYWVWWGVCVNGLFPANVVLDSTSSDAFGGNIGGGITFRVGEGATKLYTEVRYHHSSHSRVDTDILPLTFGLRW